MGGVSCGLRLGSSLLLGWWLASQLEELCLLLGRQFVLDSYEQGHLLALNFAFRRQHLFQLRENLRLVYARLLDQGDQLLHFVLQLPLQLREFQRDSSLAKGARRWGGGPLFATRRTRNRAQEKAGSLRSE